MKCVFPRNAYDDEHGLTFIEYAAVQLMAVHRAADRAIGARRDEAATKAVRDARALAKALDIT